MACNTALGSSVCVCVCVCVYLDNLYWGFTRQFPGSFVHMLSAGVGYHALNILSDCPLSWVMDDDTPQIINFLLF